MKPRITAQDIEIAVAKHFDYRRNLIVPNVYWGLGLNYEADLVVLRRSNWALEVEIKVTASDIKADSKKKFNHDSDLFRQLYFAVPVGLIENAGIPERAGIISVEQTKWGDLRCKVVRISESNPGARKWTPETRQKLYELAAMRTWTLKQHLSKQKGAA